ncbi:MAG: DUF4214 domain-containing protein [Lachnospiraceae bacterium]|nr:DUF4214 domain-containing protein [Lachnospiraceae bacterium]
MKINGLRKAVAAASMVGAMAFCPMMAMAADGSGSPEPTPSVEDVAKEGTITYDDETGEVTSFKTDLEDGYQVVDLGDGPQEVYIRNGEYDKQVSETADLINGMYLTSFDRNADQGGMDTWLTEIVDKNMGAAELVHNIFGSDEYKGLAKSNTERVQDFYLATLGRPADADGLSFWTARLDIGMSVDALIDGFAGSEEFAENCEKMGIAPGSYTPASYVDQNYERTYFAWRLYKNCLGRDAEYEGLNTWCGDLAQGQSGTHVAYGFVFSNELLEKNLSDEEFVDMLYRTIIGREPDAAGKADWMAALAAGESREHVFNGFLQSVEFGQQCAVAGIVVGDPIEE